MNHIITGFLTLIVAIGFGWYIIAPLYKWGFRKKLKNKMKPKRGYEQIIMEQLSSILAKSVKDKPKRLERKYD